MVTLPANSFESYIPLAPTQWYPFPTSFSKCGEFLLHWKCYKFPITALDYFQMLIALKCSTLGHSLVSCHDSPDSWHAHGNLNDLSRYQWRMTTICLHSSAINPHTYFTLMMIDFNIYNKYDEDVIVTGLFEALRWLITSLTILLTILVVCKRVPSSKRL